MATNRYASPCAACGAIVAANGGNLRKAGRRWIVTHTACDNGPAVVRVTFNSGRSAWRNVRGTCIDAPCCGCCGQD